ncbi:hypothetical protein [Parabacteroides sp. ZJ-118]|uniref:hypothetical protein n=1 Tax=Parabacteroides sp. ZJ-118 TaxID=2709398 RepID=UPI0013EDDEB8|nr:hypothetical protein [Parabacteroides sp. ZJ-118]
MEKNNCESCPLRAKYDRAPKSVWGRIWRWHINFCPGWKGYFKGLVPERQAELRKQYHFTKY